MGKAGSTTILSSIVDTKIYGEEVSLESGGDYQLCLSVSFILDVHGPQVLPAWK